jgi:hypothetical protein
MFPSFLFFFCIGGRHLFASSVLCVIPSVLRLKSLAFPVKTCVVDCNAPSVSVSFSTELYCTRRIFCKWTDGHLFSCLVLLLLLLQGDSIISWPHLDMECPSVLVQVERGSNESSAVGPGLHLAPSKRPPLDASCQHNYPCCPKANHAWALEVKVTTVTLKMR